MAQMTPRVSYQRQDLDSGRPPLQKSVVQTGLDVSGSTSQRISTSRGQILCE